MAKDQGAVQTNLRPRSAPRPAAAEPPRKRPSIPQFFREVRAEARRVTWTSWRETWVTSVMVGLMVIMVAVFFFGVDAFFSFLMNQVLKLGA